MKQKKYRHQKPYVSTPPKTVYRPQAASLPKPLSFLSFVLSGQNRIYLYAGLIIGVVYFIILRWLYPIPSCYSDSFTYLTAAQSKRETSFRPVEYSHIINLFKAFSSSDIALIFGQYFSNVFANLLLFFTTVFFVKFRPVNKAILFVLLLCNPLYVMYSNYILADALFGACTVAWFTMLLWMMYKPRWYYIVVQLFLLLILFKLRYNAIIFPVIMALALYMSKQKLVNKLVSLGVSVVLIIGLVVHTANVAEKDTGIRNFSAFGSWQLANNAMHILRYQKADTATNDEELNTLAKYINKYNDTTSVKFDSLTAHSAYMWNNGSPLKTYINVYANAAGYNTYFLTWMALGDVYSRFGKHTIVNNPGAYIKHFVLPNTKAYFSPDLEAYANYFTQTDTLPTLMQQFYGYPTNKVGPQHSWAYHISFKPSAIIFPWLNILFLLASIGYLATKRYREEPLIFNQWMACFLFFFVANFLFIVLLAPSVFRYHVFIITLIWPLLLYMLQQLILPKAVEKPDGQLNLL